MMSTQRETQREKIIKKAIEILEKSPKGIKYSELVKQIHKEYPEIKMKAIQWNVYDLHRKEDEVAKIGRGIFILKKFVSENQGEASYYELIKKELEKLFERKGIKAHLEITATAGFDRKLKKAIPQDVRRLSFPFLRIKKPDIFGFIEREFSNDLIVAEVKKDIKIEDIYQAKLYKEILKARYTFLVSLSEIPVEIEDLCKENYNVLHSAQDSIYNFFVIVEFNKTTHKFRNWIEENPFEKVADSYWK